MTWPSRGGLVLQGRDEAPSHAAGREQARGAARGEALHASLHRTTRQMHLTDIGTHYLDRARRIFDDIACSRTRSSEALTGGVASFGSRLPQCPGTIAYSRRRSQKDANVVRRDDPPSPWALASSYFGLTDARDDGHCASSHPSSIFVHVPTSDRSRSASPIPCGPCANRLNTTGTRAARHASANRSACVNGTSASSSVVQTKTGGCVAST
jgi:hypothetical protein